jgi:hypothetical protein
MEVTNQKIIEFLKNHQRPFVREGARIFTFPLFNEQLEVFNFDEEELTVINQLFRNFSDNDRLFIFQELRGYSKDENKLKYEQIYEDLQYIKRLEIELENELINDFIEKNSKRLILDKATKFDFNFLWYEEQLLIGYNNFVGFPLCELSRVGFNNNKTKCLLYRGFQAGHLAGMGCYIIMEKKKKNGLWISNKNKPLYLRTWQS